ncbi:hypothetical protein CR513_00543, partial [Mucuna pruriens]
MLRSVSAESEPEADSRVHRFFLSIAVFNSLLSNFARFLPIIKFEREPFYALHTQQIAHKRLNIKQYKQEIITFGGGKGCET